MQHKVFHVMSLVPVPALANCPVFTPILVFLLYFLKRKGNSSPLSIISSSQVECGSWSTTRAELDELDKLYLKQAKTFPPFFIFSERGVYFCIVFHSVEVWLMVSGANEILRFLLRFNQFSHLLQLLEWGKGGDSVSKTEKYPAAECAFA